MSVKIAALIPAHLASVRYPRKVLEPIHGLPMVEHVRRRVALVSGISEVAVATADEEIAVAIEALGGRVIRTSGSHTNGTECVAEAARTLDATHVLLVQRDEPLLADEHVRAMVDAIRSQPEGSAWNATGPIDSLEDLERHSVVKAMIGREDRVLYCARRSPSVQEVHDQTYIRKVLGLIAYSAATLQKLVELPPSVVEQNELIEQMRLIENGIPLKSVPVGRSTLSVNEPEDLEGVLEALQEADERKVLGEIRASGPPSKP